MGKKAILLGAVAALTVLLGGRGFFSAPAAHADPFGDAFDVSFTPCVVADPGCVSPDANEDVGETVGTKVHTELTVDNGSFYDAVQTVFTGIDPVAGVPVGTVVGGGDFKIYLHATALPCNSTNFDLYLEPSYNIYAALATTGAPLPSQGYAKGFTGATEKANVFGAGKWISDYDDDNTNNIPDFIGGDSGDADSAPQTTQDLDPANSKPDGVDRVPLYLPYWETVMGLPTRYVRYFGVAPVPGLPVPVDFVTYKDVPSSGKYTQFAIIQEGAGVSPALTPSNPGTSGIVTCPPFQSNINIFGNSGAQQIQTMSGSGSYTFEMSTASDWDGDGVPNYNDLCDFAPDGTNADTDGDGIGNACDTLPSSAAAADMDGDGFANNHDTCPQFKNKGDADGDGIDDACDAAKTVEGNGAGYASPAPGFYIDHDVIDTDSFTAGAHEGTGDATLSTITDSNDDHIADASDTASDSDHDGASDATEAGEATADPLDLRDQGSCDNRYATADCDHDGVAGPTVWGDGCPAAAEDGTDVTLGGQRDKTNPWDWYEDPYDGDELVDFDDVLVVLGHFGETPGNLKDYPRYSVLYDRSTAPTNSWAPGPANGVIDFDDVLAELASFGHQC